jgi:tetratricopeptide (TPR) repeat protein
VFGALIFFQDTLLSHTNTRAHINEQVLTIADDFERGQYYFNADDEQGGAYDLVQARAAYTAVIHASSTENQFVWYQLGRIDFLEGKFDTALFKFEKQVEYFGDTVPSVHYMLGLTYGYRARQTNDEQDWNNSAEEFKKFIVIKPESPWARTDLSWIYFSQGKYTEMLPVLEAGLEYHPDHAWLLNMYGLALLNTGNKVAAKDIFTKALENAKKLTVQEWGLAYPGNNPALWQEGLSSFIEAIETNLELVSE